MRRVLAALAATAFLTTVIATTARAHNGEDHSNDALVGPEARIGVLIADHGEPPEYNRFTYESFREFFEHLVEMGVVPAWLATHDAGTIAYDADCPACGELSTAPQLVDAWLRSHAGPAVYVPATESLADHYVIPGGPGLGEPDIYEHVGLAAWQEWRRMGGRSPNYDEKLGKKREVIERLHDRYGGDVPIRVGYGIDPRIGGGHQGIREALDALVNRDRVGQIVVVYHGVGFSDIMQTHHLRHQIADHLRTLRAAKLPVTYAEPMGATGHYVRAVVAKVQDELAVLPADAEVAIHLSGHGLPTTTCGSYDCGADSYHGFARRLFRRASAAVEASIDRPGRTGVFHIYGDGGTGDDDPDDEVRGPIEALDERVAEGYTHVVDIPYEFDSNSRDTLIVLRQGYGRPQPDWNEQFESRFRYRGLRVTIANANGGRRHKVAALEEVTVDALRAAGAGHGTPGTGHDHGGHHVAAPE